MVTSKGDAKAKVDMDSQGAVGSPKSKVKSKSPKSKKKKLAKNITDSESYLPPLDLFSSRPMAPSSSEARKKDIDAAEEDSAEEPLEYLKALNILEAAIGKPLSGQPKYSKEHVDTSGGSMFVCLEPHFIVVYPPPESGSDTEDEGFLDDSCTEEEEDVADEEEEGEEEEKKSNVIVEEKEIDEKKDSSNESSCITIDVESSGKKRKGKMKKGVVHLNAAATNAIATQIITALTEDPGMNAQISESLGIAGGHRDGKSLWAKVNSSQSLLDIRNQNPRLSTTLDELRKISSRKTLTFADRESMDLREKRESIAKAAAEKPVRRRRSSLSLFSDSSLVVEKDSEENKEEDGNGNPPGRQTSKRASLIKFIHEGFGKQPTKSNVVGEDRTPMSSGGEKGNSSIDEARDTLGDLGSPKPKRKNMFSKTVTQIMSTSRNQGTMLLRSASNTSVGKGGGGGSGMASIVTSLLSRKDRSAEVTPLDSIKQELDVLETSDDSINALNKLQNMRAKKKKEAYKYKTEQEKREFSQARLSSSSANKEQHFKELYPHLYESFCKYDTDGSGEIDPHELSECLRDELASSYSDEEVGMFFAKMDVNNDGSVSFLELAEWYHETLGQLQLQGLQNREGETVGNIFNFSKFRLRGNRRRPSVVHLYDEDEQVGVNSSKPYIIHPLSVFHITWDLAVSVVLILTVITLPLTMAFEELNEAMFGFNLLVDAFFLSDVVKNFFTGFIDSDGVVHMEHGKIVRRYSKTWFLPDFTSSVPIDLVLKLAGLQEGSLNSLAGGTKSIKLLKLVRLTKLFRLLRVGRAAKYISHWKTMLEEKLSIRISESTIRMMQLFMLLIVLAHWIGCIQFMICRLMDFPHTSWVTMSRVDVMSVGDQYMWSFYKALAQMIGVGYETPPITNLSCTELNDAWCTVEMWVTLVCMYLGSVFYAIMISSISSIIFSMNFASRLYNEKSQQLNEYMRNKRLPPNLRTKVREYYALRYTEGKIFNEEAIMKDLSPALQKEIKIYTSRELFLKVPFFRESGSGFISSLAVCLVQMVAFENDILIEEGTTGDNMFFVSKGEVEIFVEDVLDVEAAKAGSSFRERVETKLALSPSKSTVSTSFQGSLPTNTGENDVANRRRGSTVIASVTEGCFFGEVALLLPVRRTASARSTTVSILYVLTKENLVNSLSDFPEIADRLQLIAESRVQRVTKLLKEVASRKVAGTKAKFVLKKSDIDLQDAQAQALLANSIANTDRTFDHAL